MDKKVKQKLDAGSEIFLWLAIEELGGFLWRMNHDLADGRIDSTPGIEKDLIKVRDEIEYAVGQLIRFGVEDPKKESEKYWAWYRMWKDFFDEISDSDIHEISKLLEKDASDKCSDYNPYKEKMFFGKKLRELRIHKKMGIHKIKDAMGTTFNVSELYDIEMGYAPPPDCGRFMAQIKKALELGTNATDWLELLALRSNQPFVMQKMPEGRVASPLTHKTDGTYLTGEEHVSLNEYINNHAKEHNEKADAYNKEHGRV